MLLPNPPHLQLPLDWQLAAAREANFSFPPIGWRPEDCATCRGTKVVRTWAGSPLKSEVIEFECNCIEQMVLSRYLGIRGVPFNLRTKGMKDLAWVSQPVIKSLTSWNADPIDRAKRLTGLALVGEFPGKTLIASLIQRLLILHGLDAFMLHRGFFNSDSPLTNWKSEQHESMQEWWSRSIRPAPALILDYVQGMVSATDRTGQRIEDVMRFRADNELMTIITATKLDLAKAFVPGATDLIDTYEVLEVRSNDYPTAEIRQRELEEGIVRPVVLIGLGGAS
jgi:hypothetical protein